LAEAESELVSGFMTEHAAVIFVFFFLAEYGSILLMCILSSALFFGGYLININILSYILEILNLHTYESTSYNFFINYSIEGLIYGLSLGIKSSILVFTFI
jgi:NADH-ubiquinone oxidoreductase chain 1